MTTVENITPLSNCHKAGYVIRRVSGVRKVSSSDVSSSESLFASQADNRIPVKPNIEPTEATNGFDPSA
ncbi:hypothetical protein M7I_7316 [Glarea lozoyensis 74030]|uniref:Uncharacterized protein n=1 Tax=Glarea lozoyensis (strain ATCC 74030 / MF5533) TaxID=1104152 RepID=H0EWZ1_GLAL7|nr:hypothetical protein M7I_7316 [Glarea lozoyensis 74030]